MNCPRCGSAVASGTAFCPVCNEPLSSNPPYQAGFGSAQYPQGQPIPPTQGQAAYQPPFQQYPTGAYPPGYQSTYAYGGQPEPRRNALLESLGELLRAFRGAFTRPGEVLRELMERRDYVAFAVVTGLTLVLSFLSGMVILRGLIAALLSALSSLSGVSLASDAASLNQGINLLTGRVAPVAGGLTVLCQLLSMVLPTGAFLVCVCLVYRVPFSLELMLGFVTVTTLPAVAAALLSMLAGLLSPWLAALIVVCGMVVSYTQMCGMLSYVTGMPDQQLIVAKMICVAVSLTLTLLVSALLANLMLSGAIRNILMQLSSLGVWT